MKELTIKPENEHIINSRLTRKRGRYIKLLSYSDLVEASLLAEATLDKLLKKQARQNITAIVRPQYGKYKPEYPDRDRQIECTIRRGRKLWNLIEIRLSKVNRKGSTKVEITRDSLEPKKSEILAYVTRDLTSN